MDSLPTVLLKPGEADRVVAGHPWIYQGSILRLTRPADDGGLVQVKDHRQRFLGVGSRKIVVDWNALRFGKIVNKKDSITLELTKAQVAAAPEYKEDAPMVVLGASGSLQPLQAVQ